MDASEVISLAMRRVGILVALFVACAGEALIKPSERRMYDAQKEIALVGGPFKGNRTQIHLTFSPPLEQGVDYSIVSLASWQIWLRVGEGRRWPTTNDGRTPTQLTLLAFRDDANPSAVLEAPVAVAEIFPTPEIHASAQVIRQDSKFLVIRGANFSTSTFKLRIEPRPYAREHFVLHDLTPTQATLALRTGFHWTSGPGAVRVVTLDTGGGPYGRFGNGEVQVAAVQTNKVSHAVKVDVNEGMKIYRSAREFDITGEGFNENVRDNTLVFVNDSYNGHFQIVRASTNSLTVRLLSRYEWPNEDNLPIQLTLLAINVGTGFVAVGPEGGREGCVVATVHEPPRVSGARFKLSRMDSRELHIFGAGFPENSATDVELEFERPFVRGVDYYLRVLNRGQLQLLLLEGKSWGEAGPLTLKSISTIGSGGHILLDSVQVAEVMPDNHVDVSRTEQKVYQSALQQPIMVRGYGFKPGITLTFSSGIQEGVDFDVHVEDSTSMRLSLRDGKKWASEPGPLALLRIKVSEVEMEFEKGIQIASVLLDPSVVSTSVILFATESKVLWLFGAGFTDIEDVRVDFAHTPQDAFDIEEVLPDRMRLRLKDKMAWDSRALGHRKPMQLVSIDTGAGQITFQPPIAIGQVIRNHAHGRCDDSCEFAVDGVCGDLDFAQLPDNRDNYDDDDFYLMDDDKRNGRECAPGTDCTDCQQGGIP